MQKRILIGVDSVSGKRIWSSSPKGTGAGYMIWKDTEGHRIDVEGHLIENLQEWEVIG